jgi:hypothetical protein
LVLFPDEYIRLVLRELMSRPKPADPANRRGSEPAVGNGLFVLTASFSANDSYPDATWKETSTRRLDEMLNDIVGDLYALVEDRREKRAQWADEQHKRQMEETRRWRRSHRRSQVATRDKQQIEAAQAFAQAKEVLAYADVFARVAQKAEGVARERGFRAAARLRRTARRLSPLALR